MVSLKRIFFITLVFLFIYSNDVSAEQKIELFTRSCSDYTSAEEFVRQSNMYCLQQPRTRSCIREARNYFRQCKYEGDFKALSQEVHRKLLAVFLFSKPSELAKIL